MFLNKCFFFSNSTDIIYYGVGRCKDWMAMGYCSWVQRVLVAAARLELEKWNFWPHFPNGEAELMKMYWIKTNLGLCLLGIYLQSVIIIARHLHFQMTCMYLLYFQVRNDVIHTNTMGDQLDICSHQRIAGGYKQHHPWPISEYTEGEELRNIGCSSIPAIKKITNIIYLDTCWMSNNFTLTISTIINMLQTN